MPEIVVHHLEASRSLRLLWLLEELELDYEIRTYPRNPETMRAPPELRELHPLGKAPIVTIDGSVLAESGAIIEHVVARFGERLRPPEGTEALDRYRYFMHYAEGSLMAPLLVRLIFDKIRSARLPFFIKPISNTIVSKVDASFTMPEITRHTEFLEGTLADRPWFAGEDFTAADIQMIYPVEALFARGRSGGTPNLQAWLERAQARPAYQRAVDKGGPAFQPRAAAS